MLKQLLFLSLLFLPFLGFSQTHNAELQQMADADQKERGVSNINWKILNAQDSSRRARIFELIKDNKVITAKDHFNVGVVFQHGNDTVASALAVKSFKTALELDSTLNRWWYAAAVDRDLMRRKLPQIYGTQYVMLNGEKWKRYQIDTTKITDQQRKYYTVETLAEQVKKERQMNQKSISALYAETKDISKTLAEINRQFQLGSQAAYNVSEDGINSFGYELVGQNLNIEALQVLELNTKLYPTAFNTFDSYGEILMKVGKKKEALSAYKKSLSLNPKNDNARKILDNNKAIK